MSACPSPLEHHWSNRTCERCGVRWDMLTFEQRWAVWMDAPFGCFASITKTAGSGVRRRDDETASEYADRAKSLGVRTLSDEAIESRVESAKAGKLDGVPKAGTLREGGKNQYTKDLR